MSQRAPLASTLLKIERAKEHRDALEKYVRETFAIENNRPRCGVKYDAETGEYVLFINHMPDLCDFLDRCSLIFADGLNCLRAALDHLAYQLAVLHTNGKLIKEGQIQFPICDTPESWNGEKGRRLREIAPEHVAIIERYQGYHRIDNTFVGDEWFHPLSMLRDLIGQDKHRLPIKLVIPTSQQELPSMNVVPLLIAGWFQKTMAASGRIVPIPSAELGAEVMRAKLPPGMVETNVDVAAYIAPHIAIEGHRNVVATFDRIAATVVKVVREFEPAFK